MNAIIRKEPYHDKVVITSKKTGFIQERTPLLFSLGSSKSHILPYKS